MKSFDIISIRQYFPSIENPSASSWVYNQAKEIQKFGISPIVISPTPEVPWWINKFMKNKHAWKIKSNTTVQNYLGVEVIRPPYIKLPGKYFFDYNIRQISKCIQNSAYNIEAKVIHAHFGHAGVASLKVKKLNNLPLITSFYGFDLGSDKIRLDKYYKILAKEGDLFLALSEDMKMDLLNIGFPENKIVVYHLGIDIEKFAPQNHDKQKNDDFIFTIVASFTERKGIHYAIEAFKKFKKKHLITNCKLRIVGDGPFLHKLKQLSDFDIDIVFINNFIAEKPRELVLQEMQNCDIFILTSITLPDADKEGTPVVLMEAQACGKPCISTYHAGIPEVVIHNKTGLLVKERDSDSIAKAMFELYSDQVKRNILGKNASIHIEEKFNNRIQIPKLFDIYKPFLK